MIKGTHHSAETIKKLIISHKGQKSWNKGKHLSEDHIKKLRDTHKCQRPWMRGKHPSILARIKMSEAQRGKKSHMWKGGIAPYTFDFNKELKLLVHQRDNHRCQLCVAPSEEVHHIDYNKKNSDSTNLIALCIPCHKYIHRKEHQNKKMWIYYFEELLKLE